MKNIRLHTAPDNPIASGTEVHILHPEMKLHIPSTLMLTDMFEREVITPESERTFFTKDDTRALIAHTYITTLTEARASVYVNLQQRIPTDLLLSAVVYQELSTLTDTYIENVILEMKDAQSSESTVFFPKMIEMCASQINSFMRDTLSELAETEKVELYGELLGTYIAIATIAGRRRNVTYHPEVLNGE